MIKKSHFPIQFDEACRECTFDVDREEVSDLMKKLIPMVEKSIDCPVKCVVCQFKIIYALNGDGVN
jgi:hypothetical protein